MDNPQPNIYNRNLGHIYVLTSPSGKQYVGQAICISSGKEHGYKGRWKGHISEAKYSKNTSVALNNAILKYGSKSFQVVLMEETNISNLNERERYWIKKLNTISPDGYNLTSGGDQGYMHNETTKEKISNTRIKKQIGRGKILSRNYRKRQEDVNLPKYVVSCHDKNGRSGYMIINHPDIKNKKFTSKKLTMEEKLELILEYLKAPEIKTTQRKTRKRKTEKVNKLPLYMCNYNYEGRQGYRISGHPTLKDKIFSSSKFSLEEKYNLASNYLNS